MLRIGSLIMGVGLLCGTLAAVRPVEASHNDFRAVARAARDLHCALQEFEAIACLRPLSAAERDYLRKSVDGACRLAEKAMLGPCDLTRDFLALRSCLRTLDHLLHCNGALRGDRELWCKWAEVERRFSDLRCALTRPVYRSRRPDHFPPPTYYPEPPICRPEPPICRPELPIGRPVPGVPSVPPSAPGIPPGSPAEPPARPTPPFHALPEGVRGF